MTAYRKRFENIFPARLNGSRKFSRMKLSENKDKIVTINRLYLSHLTSFSKRKYFFLFKKCANLEKISCNVPNGQILEQYTLPNKTVRTRTTIKPVANNENKLKNFIIEGTN
jgi:hypothetical protein